MKKTTFLKVILLAFIFLQSFISYSQTLKPFTPRFDKDIKGDMLLIGNSILNRSTTNRTPNSPYNGDNLNSDFDMQFINIDNGATSGVFNSSSANLVVPNASAPAAPCYKILYAALYWGAVTKGTTPITDIKFKMPTGGYNDVVGTIIHDSGTNVIGTSYPYACYADVTSLVTGAGNPTPEGTYTVANVSSKVGTNGGTGLSAGWSLFIVYEDPKLAAKSITSFDGFSAISSTVNLDIPVTGFRTIPTGPVRAKFAFSSLEGDQGISGDYLTINGSILSAVNNAGTTIRGTNNFFNSSVTYIDPANGKTEDFINRNPASTNTLGYDAGILEINNNGNAIIKNNDISAVIGLRSNQDVYFYYFNAISLEIIEPKIVLTKQVFSDATLTNNIGNANVTLGQELFYAIGFQNIGNDNAENFTIKDILPININFDPNNIIVPNGSGITYVYDAATRTIVFTIPSNLVEKNDPRYIIKFKVQVVPECNDLSDACSDKIQNQAFASYVGVTSDIKVDDQLSLSTFGECYLGTASPTNFLVGVENCIYTKDYQLCGASVVLTAANGYNSYSWSTSATGTPVIGTTQSITVSQTGTYYVNNIANAPCRSIKQVVTVSPSGTTVQNPVIPFADQVVQCPNNGKDLPKIFLCGANATRLINTGVTDAISIVWQKLNEASCTAIGTDDCANEKVDCTWDNIATGSSYTANTSGQFRVVFNYAGGCFNIFYFNVFKNLLNPTATSKDIICNTSGEIIVGGVPTSGYEFSLSASGPFQDSNVFSITTANTYTVYIRQKGIVSNPCLFSVPGIDILQRNFTVSEFVSQPLCNGDKGSIKLAANDVRAQYFYSISKSGSLVNAVGPIAASDHTFSNLSPGSYDYEVKTDDGCLKTGTIVLIEPDVLEATVNQTKALTCETGEITVYPIGGTAPYAYYVNGSTTAQYSAVVNTPTAGNYTIRVVDYNGCIANTSITIAAVPKPVYNPTGTNVNCYGDTTGVINFNVTNANGYTLAYSINNGTTYGSSPIISNLAAGTYNTVLKYSLNGVDCLDTMKVITITQPSTALTASAGVSELAGCGPAGEGKIRITNPQGGTPTYEYSFDNQTTWTTVNDAYKAPGTYTVYIKDANGCIYPMPNIIIEPEPVAPVIDVNTPVDFNCDGTATSTVTINNPGTASFTYNYYLDGTINPNTTNPNTFLNVAPGTHTVKVEYNLVSVPTYSNLLKEDFGYGDDTTSPGINTAFYCFERQVVATQCKGSTAINDGDYSVTANIVNPFSAWVQPGDHTTQTVPPTPKGRSLVVNIGDQIATSDILYQKVINDIIPNQPINFELYAMNLLKTGNTQVNADLRVALVNAAGVEISWFATGDIPKTQKWEVYPKTPVTLNPGANTTLRFIIRSNKRATSGNDVAIDDIKVFQLPKSCITTRSFTVVVPTGKAFTGSVTGFKNVTCAGADNGEITIAAQNFDTVAGYQYSLDNGTTWVTITTSPYTILNLPAANYNVMIRPDATALPSCVKTTNQPISAPALVTVDASITTLATCTTGATITAVGGGGTPAYQYELRQVITGLESVVTAFNTNANFTNVPAGDYVVYVRDANTCISPVGKAISVIAPPALTASLATTTDYCYTTANPATLDVTVTGGTGPFTYKLDGNAAVSSASTSYSFSNVAPGTHDIVVTDSNNCTYTISSIVIAPQIAFNVSLLNDLTCSDDASIGNPIVTNGNVGSYTYTVSHNSAPATAVTTFPYSATVAGTYVFTVTDSKGCPATSNTITVTAKTTPTHTTAKTNITCNNANDGTITVTPSGGFTTTYTYAIKLNSVATYTTQSTNQFTGLAAGIYDVYVIDSKGCPSIASQVTIVNPDIVAATTDATEIQCSATGTVPAVVTVTASGGTAPYKYSFNSTTNFTNANTYSTSVAGTVTAYIQDANGCQIGPFSETITALEQITLITITDSGYDCATTPAGGHVNIAASGVSAPIRFQIISGPAGYDTAPNADGEFKSLAPGTYVFQATDTKTNCSLTKSYTVNGAPDIVAGGSVLTPISCFGGTGTIQFTVSGVKDRGYNYIIRNAANVSIQSDTNVPETITTINVPTAQLAGVYTITVTDRKTLCTDDYSVTLTQPTALIISSATPTTVNCNNDNAQITVLATGGTTNYSYAFAPSLSTIPTSTYGTNPVFTVDTNSATQMSWDVYVKDANGCTQKTTVAISSDPTPTVTAALTGQCTSTTGSFTITATGSSGTGTLMYGINGTTGAFQSSAVFTVVPRATPYTVWVKDANGCTSSAAPITVYPQLTVNGSVTKTLDCNTAGPNATITATITGGKANYSYVITNGVGTTVFSDSGVTGPTITYTGAAADTYTVTVTDANTPGCTASTTIKVDSITNPTVAVATQVNVSCNAGSDGSVTLIGSGGSGGYTYSNNATSGFTATATFGGLTAAGSPYTFYVKDSNGCIGSRNVIITEPSALALNANITTPYTCDGPATITASASNGNGGFTYVLTRGTTTVATNTIGVFPNLSVAGSYTVTVTDAKGCSITSSPAMVIVALTPPTAMTFTNTAVTCPANKTAITIDSVTGGSLPLEYRIIAPASAATAYQAGATFAGLDPGVTYRFEVRDAKNCTFSATYSVPVLPTLTASGVVVNNVRCFGESNGSVRYTVGGFGNGTPYSYTIDGSAAGAGTSPGTGTTFDILVSGLAAGPRVIVVTNTNTSCTVSASVTVGAPSAALAITAPTISPITCTALTASININTTGGWGFNTYTVTGPSPATTVVTQTTRTFNNLAAGDYTATVTDVNSCTVSIPFTIAPYTALVVTPTVTNACSVAGNTNEIVATATGGSGTYTYSINTGTAPSGALLNTFNVAPGTYTITVRDAFGCIDTETVTVSEVLTATAVRTKDITCSTPQEATINVNVIGGKENFGYRVNIGATGFSGPVIPFPIVGSSILNYTATSLTGTSYQFEISDANGCIRVTNIVNTNTPTPVTATPTPIDPTCNGSTDGSIRLTATAGVAPFTYAIALDPAIPPTASLASDNVFGGLAAGTYNYIVRDAKGCDATGIIVLNNPAPVFAAITVNDIICNTADTPGSIEITNVTGGFAPFTFTLLDSANNVLHVENTSLTAFSFPNTLNFGDYYVTVSDSKGCEFKSVKLRINSVPYLKFLPVSITGDCITGATVNLQIDTTFPTAPNYIYSIYGDPTSAQPATSSTSATFTGLNFGRTYLFQVIDNNNCTSIVEVVIAPLSPIKIDPVTITNVTCNTSPVSTNGAISFTVFDYSAGVTQMRFQILDQLTNQPLTPPVSKIVPVGALTSITDSFTGLSSGAYTLKVEEVDGTRCSVFYPFDITQPIQPLTSVIASTVNATCDAGALVRLTTTGGTGPYTYTYAVAPNPPTIVASSNVLNLDYNLGTSWNIRVTDVNGCTFDLLNVPIAKDPTPVIDLSVADKCVAEGAFEILVTQTTVGVGTHTISIDGSDFTSLPPGNTFTGLNSGSHSVTIKDANGCTNTETIIIAAPLKVSPFIDALPTCANNDGQVTLTASGGTGAGTYSYTISPSPVGVVINNATGVISSLPAGTYTITMSDLAIPTNCTTTTEVTLSAATTVVYTATPTAPSCTGTQGNIANGTIDIVLDASNNNPQYTYSITRTLPTAAPSVTQSNGLFTGLIAGTYNVLVSSARGCSTPDTIVVPDPTPVVASALTSAFTCSTTNALNATVVTLGASGGAGTVLADYTFSRDNSNWSSTNTFDVIDTGVAQNLTFYAKDANDCIDDIIVPIAAFPKLVSAVASLGTQADCTTPTEIINVSITGGATPANFSYQVAIDGGGYGAIVPITAGATSFTYPATSIGSFYEFKITDNTTGCSIISNAYTVPVFNTMTVTASAAANVDCATNATGAIEINIGNYTGPYNYTIWLGGVATAFTGSGNTSTNPFVLLHGLVAGNNYTVVVAQTTYPSCSVTSNPVAITEPVALDLTNLIVNVKNQNCNSTGAVLTVDDTTIAGGTRGFEFAFVPAGTSPIGFYSTSITKTIATSATAATPDLIDVYVKDANGCFDFVTVPISLDAAPSIAAPTAVCNTGAPIVIDLSLLSTVPVGPAQFYTVNGSNQTNPTYTITAPGTYNFSVTDANGCVSNVVSYTLRPQLTLQADMTQDLTCPAPASITLVPDGGTTVYTFEVNFNNGGYNVIAGSPYTTAIAGTYKFRVTDSQGCQAESQEVIVTPNTTPTATTAFTNVSCIGATDGTITLTPSGGNVAYEYSLDGVTYQSSNVFSGLGVGPYSIVVRDAKLCVSAPILVTIGNPAALTATATVTPFGCDTANAPIDAVVTIAPVGGTGVYSYSINGGSAYQTSPSFSVNTAQTINYIVKDANGCTFPGSANVLPYTPPTDMDLTASPIYCSIIPAEATVTVNTVTGGVGPFVFEIISPATAMTVASAPSSTPYSFTNLAPDTYTIKVTDANGCSTTKAILVEEADKIAVTAQLINNVYCTTDSTGIIEFTVTDYIAPASYIFNLSPSLGVMTQVGDVIRYTGVPAGAYTFTVTDNTSGCVASVSNFAVTEPLQALDFNSSATNINCDNDEATITVLANGGTLNYKYAVALATAPAPPVTAYSLSNTLTVDTNNGAAMNWIVYVMDANGCAINKPQTILADANPSNITVATYSECPDALTGTYTFTVNLPGGVAPFTYSIGGGFQSSPTFVVNAPGSYDVTVMDANGCPTTEPALVVIRQPLILTPIVDTPVSCANNDGIITVSTTGGSNSLSNYQYKIDGGTYPMATPFAGLAFGLHRVYVQDIATGCEVYVDIDLQEATPITGFALAKTEVTCNGGNDGTITATMDAPADGVNDNPVYTYVLSGTTTVTSTAVNRGPQDSPLFSGLAAGTYTVTVTSERGCTDDSNIIIVEPALIDVPTPTVVPFGCTTDNVGNFATITVTAVTGGSNSYLNYEFIKNGTQVQFGASNVYTEADLLGGSYIVNVYDDKGCIGTTTAAITIDPYIALDKVNVVIDQAITCNNLENITVSATIIGVGTTNLEYTLVDVIYDPITGVSTTGTIYPAVPNNNGIFTGLPVGNYLITVKNLDTNCEIQGVHYVNEPNTFDLTIDTVVDVTCFSGTNGSVNVTFVDRLITTTPVNGDDAGAFTYTLEDAFGNGLPGGTSTSEGPITISGLAAGTYTITATLSQSPSCPVIKNFTITGPTAALHITETHTEITCVTGNNDGTIAVTATGGWPGAYEFELVGPTPAQNIAYSAQTEFTGLTAGTYTINVRDSKGCVDFITVTLADPAPIVFTATSSSPTVSCFGDTSATISAGIPTGGSGNYLYSLVTTYPNGTVTTDGPQVSNTFTNLGAGSYQVQVSDSWTCSALSAAIVITEPAKVTASLALATAISCDVDATLTLTASGGTAPYEYSTTSNFGTVIAMTGNNATFSVLVGTYNYYIRDINGCVSFISNDITIDKVPDLVIDVNIQNAVINCKGDDSGVIVATAQGGLGNYVYTLLDGAGNALSFTPVQTSLGNFTNLPAGSYLVNVVSMDCEARTVVPVVITEPDFPLTESNAVTNITCAGEGDGKIVITASGGTGIIKYAISPDLNQFFESNVFDNLKPGTYDYIVQDENGCFIYITGVVISEPNSIFVTTISGTEMPEVCAGDADGAFSINVTGGNAPYSVSLDDVNGTYTPGTLVQTQFDFTGLSGSEHVVYVRDANNCTTEHTVILGEAVTLNPQASVNYDCVSNSASNSVTVTADASNLPADLDYALDGSTVFQASNVFTDLTPGQHTIDVRHTNGCTKQVVFDVIQVDPLTLTLVDGGLNEIVATATGGGGNYQYTLDGESYGTQSNFIIYKSGDYTVTVTDINGCTATATRYFEFIDIKIPNVFTPNGDGNNDTWAPTNTINYKDLVFYVYDRYGRKLGSYRESQFWDGKYNGNELPSGDYWYVIKIRDVKDAREFVGHFTLYR